MEINQKTYQILSAQGYVTLKLTGDCDSSNVAGADVKLLELLVDPFPHVVINCEHLTSLSKEWVRLLLNLQTNLKKIERSMMLILVSPNMKATLKREGLDTAFKTALNLREALVELGLATKKMLDADFVNPFLVATLHVLKVQASVNAEQGKIFLKDAKSTEGNFVGDVSGVIGIVSDSFTGSVVISFPETTFLKVMSGMLGEEFTEMSKDILDGAGEITNMIFGQAKIVLNEKGYGIRTAIPSVVAGKNHVLTPLTKGPTVVVPFKSSAGDFFIEICISNDQKI